MCKMRFIYFLSANIWIMSSVYSIEPGVTSIGVCQMNPELGTCDDYSVKWFYNSTSGRCKLFLYGGCGGNNNRFDDAVSCSRRCRQNEPDAVCNPGWYGSGCQQQCGHCKGNETCHYTNGSCPTSSCDPGWYGSGCRKQCGYCRGNKPCHHVTGSCSGLCAPGYLGDQCEDSFFSKHLANQRKMIKLMRELLFHKRRRVELKEKSASPTAF